MISASDQQSWRIVYQFLPLPINSDEAQDLNSNGIMYLMEPDHATIGEIAEDEKNWSDDNRLVT
jgi:hypothetical protein